MKFLLLSTCILAMAYASCEDKNTCFCPNITLESYNSHGGWVHTDNPDGRLFYSEGPGCSRNLTCQLSFNTYFVSGWDNTNIPKPKDLEQTSGISIHAQNPESEKTGAFVNLQELFGIVCEDFKWMITKYPYGYSYMSQDTFEYVYVDASKMKNSQYKTEVKQFYCDGDEQDIDYYSQLN